ncbi:response regulator transcription factor [Colwellia psychrerythraea]|nr:response regulator transcription factor [Colwellia psychrerythraea]
MTVIKQQDVSDCIADILIVEDDESLAQWMKKYLVLKNFTVNVISRGDLAVDYIKKHNPDIVVLDGMLPGLDGFDVCKAVRPAFTNAIIMVTARDEEIDEVLGLDAGADDYLTKPLRARALLARIDKWLKRQSATTLQEPMLENNMHHDDSVKLTLGKFIIDAQARSVSLDGEIINISTNEFDLLWILAERAGQVVARSELMMLLKGYEYDGFDRTVDLRISKLRKKLQDNTSQPYRIKTIWGKGYLLVKDAW